MGQLVQYCIKEQCGLEDLDLKTYKRFDKHFSEDLKTLLSITSSVNSRQSIGGTALECVKKEIARAKKQ